MAVLGTKRLLELVREINLVENLSERELKGGEGAGFDLRIGELHKFKENIKDEELGFLGIIERSTPPLELIAKYDLNKTDEEQKIVTINQGEYYILKTIEEVNMPPYLRGGFVTRTTLIRSGLKTYHAVADPGYSGGLNFGIKNHSNLPYKIQMGSRVVQMEFQLIDGETKSYEGQWQKGRTSTNGKKERQI